MESLLPVLVETIEEGEGEVQRDAQQEVWVQRWERQWGEQGADVTEIRKTLDQKIKVGSVGVGPTFLSGLAGG
ncbi:hypothetical protein DAEQUDRAFT_765359 [Daedalea quercina L-15889]|uniref:Uncharacterized protein n=1 Tax=Daedalea quercina L-15889 TaxID=1314783 RepID=A0A165QII2_9APHY|nr:hypothetical protein DAEQUDRAFT_765359 [Daedalea quercina L-15889]